MVCYATHPSSCSGQHSGIQSIYRCVQWNFVCLRATAKTNRLGESLLCWIQCFLGVWIKESFHCTLHVHLSGNGSIHCWLPCFAKHSWFEKNISRNEESNAMTVFFVVACICPPRTLILWLQRYMYCMSSRNKRTN